MPEPRERGAHPAARLIFLSPPALGVSLCNRGNGGMTQCSRRVRPSTQRPYRAGWRLAELRGFMSCSVPAVRKQSCGMKYAVFLPYVRLSCYHQRANHHV